MTMITPSYLGETIEYSSLHACRSTLEDPTQVAVEEALRVAITAVWLFPQLLCRSHRPMQLRSHRMPTLQPP